MSETQQNFEIDQNFFDELKSRKVKLKRYNNKDESEEYWKLIHSVNNIKEFHIKDSKFIKDFEENIPKLIESNPELNSIFFGFNEEPSKFDTKLLKQSLKANTSLNSLSLMFSGDRNVKKSDLRLFLEVFQDSFITDLLLNFIEINNTNLKSISKMKNLQTITFYYCEFNESIYEPSISVQNVYLTFNKTESYNFIKILENISYLEIYSDSSPLDFLKFADSLKRSKLKKLTLLEFVKYENQDHFKDILDQNLVDLEINDILISNMKDFPYFSSLKENNTLKVLTLKGMKNFKDLDTFLKNNQVILELDIDNIQNNMKILSQGLANNHSLESLSFHPLLEDDFQYLSQGLMHQDRLTSLDLFNCKLNDDSLFFFTEYLSSNKVLKKLVLSFNQIGDIGIKYICDGLKHSKTIQNLNLERNLIQDEGCKHLGNFIKFNQSIQTLDLNKNRIKNNGLNYLSEGLIHNYSLENFFCRSDFIDLENVEEFRNNIFYNFCLCECKISSYPDKKIEFLMNRNSEFIFNIKKMVNGFYDLKFGFE